MARLPLLNRKTDDRQKMGIRERERGVVTDLSWESNPIYWMLYVLYQVNHRGTSDLASFKQKKKRSAVFLTTRLFFNKYYTSPV